MSNNPETLNRWRLVLGRFAEGSIGFEGENNLSYREMDEVLDFLYGREYGEERDIREGGSGAAQLSIPKWISKIRELFPKKTVEILEKHALNRYNLSELLTDREVLEKLEPNLELLKSIMQLKHLMRGEVLETARGIVRQVAEEIRKTLEQQIRAGIVGRVDKNKTGRVKSARNIDFKRTIKKNLHNYDLEQARLLVDKVYFNSRIQYYNPWHVIIAVDESGSMLDSVIHSAVMAGIFARLPMLKTHLVIFDTQVVDLTQHVDDPVQTLMSVQLGGGTNIARALGYCYGLMENPYRTMVVVVTDLCEGGPYDRMYSWARSIIESGAKLLILTSLDASAVPVYDRRAAEKISDLGANVAALTPEELAGWISAVIS